MAIRSSWSGGERRSGPRGGVSAISSDARGRGGERRSDAHWTASGLAPGPPRPHGAPSGVDLAPEIGVNEYRGPADSLRRR
jgi:hypothetical protein